MGLKGLLDRNEEPSDVESEREALRRQRAEAADELEALKRTLSERVACVQQRERELAEALARVEKREQKLVTADGASSRLDSVRLRLAGSEGNACRARCSREGRARDRPLRRELLRQAAIGRPAGSAASRAEPELDGRESA